MTTELHAVFATDGNHKVFRVSDPMSWDDAQREWDRLYTLKHEDRLPHVKFFEVRSVTLGPDRPLVGPEVRSHDRYDRAPISMQMTRTVVKGRGYATIEKAAREAWRDFAPTYKPRRTHTWSSGIQGLGGWFFYPNGTTAAQGLKGLVRVVVQRAMIVQGINGRYYVIETAEEQS
jgi:hypothetical protein